MIKLVPYTELPNRNEIFNRYLFMAGMSMPFFRKIFSQRGISAQTGKQCLS